MATKAKEILHDLVLEVIKEHCTIIQKVITDCLTPATTVTATVGKDDNDTESINVIFDNSVLKYTASVSIERYMDTCIEHDIFTAIKLVVCSTLKGFSDCMFDIFFSPMSEQEKILKNIK